MTAAVRGWRTGAGTYLLQQPATAKVEFTPELARYVTGGLSVMSCIYLMHVVMHRHYKTAELYHANRTTEQQSNRANL